MAISVGSLAFETEKLRLFDKGPSFNGHRKAGLPFLTCGTAGNRSSGEPETGARRKPEFVLKGKPERIAISVDPLVMDGIAINPRDFPRYVLSDKAQKSRLENDSSAPGLDNSSDLSNDLSVGPNHKSGYVALVGRPNVGKSTLMNQLIGQKLSIVTSKPQTTRHRILGICSEVDYQMILFDTPGVIPKKMHKLDDMMMQNVKSATINADCVLVIVDATENPEKALSILEDGASEAIKKRPTLLVLNKKDLIKPGEIAKKKQLYEEFNDLDEVIVVSAKYGHGVDELKKWLVSKLPLGPAYYPKDYVSEHPEKFFVSEIVREKIFMQYVKEIPYCCQVNVSNYVEREPPAKDFVGIEIIVEKETQKAILLGKNGQALKTLATAARLDIEDFVGRQVYIETRVKVREHWRKDEDLLREYGYSGKF